MNQVLSALSMEDKLAVVQLGFQLICGAKQAPISEEDDPSIDYIINSIGYANNPSLGNFIWNEGSDANKVNPFDAFSVVSHFSITKKEAFKCMIDGLCSLNLSGSSTIRMCRLDIAQQIYQKVGIY